MPKNPTKKTPSISPIAKANIAKIGTVADADGYGQIQIPNVPPDRVTTTIETAKAMLGDRFDSADIKRQPDGNYTVIIYTKP